MKYQNGISDDEYNNIINSLNSLDCNNDNYSWCDITVRQCDLTPFEWIGYFRYAKKRKIF